MGYIITIIESNNTMQRITRFLAVVLLICSTSLSCIEKEKHEHIRLMNMSDDKDVVIQTIALPYKNWPPRLPDSIFQYQCSQDVYYVHTESFIDIECPGKNWEDFFKHGELQINVMDGESFNQYYSYPCDTIRKYVLPMLIYRFYLDEIQELDWIIPYPPTEKKGWWWIYRKY